MGTRRKGESQLTLRGSAAMLVLQTTFTKRAEPCWEVIRDNLEAGVASRTFKVPSAKSSVKTIACSWRLPAAANSTDLDVDVASRHDPNLETYQFHVNGINYPHNPVSSKKQMLMEAMKAWHNPHGLNTAIRAAAYGIGAAGSNGNPARDKFFIAQSFDAGLGASSKTFSGVSTLAANPLILTTFTGGASAASNVFYYVEYDCKYSITNGVITVSY